MMSRVGVLGGMFDPIHNGHVEAAKFASESMSLDSVKLIPCSIPNHREHAHCLAEHRVAMLELATSGHANLEVDEIEINREGVSYTVDTLRQLKSQEPEARLVFILGLDSFNTLPKWKDWNCLFDLCSLFVLSRNNENVVEQVAQQTDLVKRQVQSPTDLVQAGNGRICIVDEFDFDLSSTKVRNKLSMGLDISADVNEGVFRYIHEHSLYH